MLYDIYFLSGNIFVVFHLSLPSKKKAGYAANHWRLLILRLPGSCWLVSRFLTSLNPSTLFHHYSTESSVK